MRRIPSILPCVAAAVVWLTATSTIAQQPWAKGDERATARVKARELAARAHQQQLLGLANQLRPFYRYELMHVRAACKLTKEELRRIRPEADAAYEQAIAGLQAGLESRRFPVNHEPDYHEAIREAVHSVVERHVSRERWAVLQADLRARASSRKEVGVDLLVAEVDRVLLLSEDQRKQIAASLCSHWDDRWCDPMEAAFAQESRCPELPDELVIPYLSAEQVQTWHRVPRSRGERLWGVTIDHGGDPAMDRDLGGDGGPRPNVRRNWIVLDPPPNAVIVRRRPVAEAMPDVAVLQRVVVRQPVARQPAPIDQDGDAEDRAAQAQQRLRQQQAARIAMLKQILFEQRVFGDAQGEEPFRREAEAALAKRIDSLDRACRLTDPQRRKLRAAGQGDLKRFIDHVDEARRSFPEDGDGNVALLIQRAAAELVAESQPLLTAEGPIFTGALARTLADEQRASLEKDPRDRLAFRHRADVRWTAVLLARSLGLIDDQRRRLEAILLERTRPPRRFDSFDYTIVMYQAARIPEDEMRPIFDDLQWRVMTEEFAAIRRWGLHLKQGHFLPDEMFVDDPGGGVPPIQMLAPPQFRR